MIIRLPWIDPIDTEKLPRNFEELVQESFRQYTRGTRKDYQYHDKLLYLDNLRSSYTRGIDKQDGQKIIKNLIGDYASSYFENFSEMPRTDEILDEDFMVLCYKEGFLPFYSKDFDTKSDRLNDEVMKVILKIIQIVVNYDEVRKDN